LISLIVFQNGHISGALARANPSTRAPIKDRLIGNWLVGLRDRADGGDDVLVCAHRRRRRHAGRGPITGFKVKLGCHMFRATGITAYLKAGGTLENAQTMAAHESPRTTKLYDRRGDEITYPEDEKL
jgi:integrase